MKTILVTRPSGEADPLVVELRARGYRVIAVPTVATRPLEAAWPKLASFDWIVVTSVAGVERLPQLPSRARWAAVGRSTAAALRKRGVAPEVVPEEANGAALAEALPDASGKRVLLVRASLADQELPEALRRRGARVEELIAYETVEGPLESAAALHSALSGAGPAAVVFASGSAVRGFLKLGGAKDLPAITIGPRTSAAARAEGFAVLAEAESPSPVQLADAVERAIPVEVRRDA